MNKSEFLDRQRRARGEWEAALAEVGPERMAGPGSAGYWSVKDIVAHVAWFEREMVGLIRARALEGSELWDLDQDARNAVVYEQNRDRPVDEVVAEAERVYAELLPVLEGMSDEEYTEPARFRGMPPAWEPWRVIAGNTWEHYEAHLPSIRAWLDAQDDQADPAGPGSSPERNKETFRRMVAAWTGELGAVGALVTRDYTLHASSGDLDAEGMKARTRALIEKMPDVAFTVEDQFAQEDRVATRMSAEGTDATTGQRLQMMGISIARFAGGKIAEEWAAWETLES